MRTSTPRAICLTVFLAASLSVFTLGSGGCGFKTAPQPPELTAPIVPGEISLSSAETGVRVVWNRAKTNAAGDELFDLAGFAVERAAENSNQWFTVARIPVTDNARFRRTEKFSWVDPSAGDQTWDYRVRAFSTDGQSGPPTPTATWPVIAVD
ncbi:MAG: hypothetical protein ACI8TX_003556 [Hyphomicrobiaceae bacterium]|jgi:hypothetical protein